MADPHLTPTGALHDLRRWLRAHADAGTLPPDALAVPPDDLRRLCRGDLLPVLAFLCRHLPPPDAVRRIRGNLQLAAAHREGGPSGAEAGGAALRKHRARLQQEIRAAKQRQGTAEAAGAATAASLAVAEQALGDRRRRHREEGRRAALYDTLAHRHGELAQALAAQRAHVHGLLAAVTPDAAAAAAPRITLATLAGAPAPRQRSEGLQGAAVVRRLEGAGGHCCFAFRQDCLRLRRHTSDDDDDEVAGLRRRHIEGFLRVEGQRAATHALRQKSAALRDRVLHLLTAAPGADGAEARRALHSAQRSALRAAGLAAAQAETGALLERRDRLLEQRRVNRRQAQDLEDKESQLAQRAAALRHTLWDLRDRHAAASRLATAVAAALRGLPGIVADTPNRPDTATVAEETDVIARFPFSLALYRSDDPHAMGSKSLPSCAPLVGVPSHTAPEVVLGRMVALLARERFLRRRTAEWHALRDAIGQFTAELGPTAQGLEGRRRDAEAVFRSEGVPPLRAAAHRLRTAAAPTVQMVQGLAEDWAFEPAVFHNGVTAEDIPVAAWLEKCRTLRYRARADS